MSILFSSPFQLHIVAGQSNAHGSFDNASHYPADEQGIDQNIPFFYEAPTYGSSAGQWVQMGPQEGMYGTRHFGPEVAFARALYRAKLRPAIFKFTMPASSLCHDWREPGDGGLFDALGQAWKLAIQAFPLKQGRFKVTSVTWLQGESDAETEEMAVHYEARLRRILAHLRQLVGKPRLPVILGVHEEHPWVLNQPAVVDAHKEIARDDPAAAFCSMLGLEQQEDSHLTPAGLVQHGEQLFKVYRSLARSQVRSLLPSIFLRRWPLSRVA